jgi:hypothetical protein
VNLAGLGVQLVHAGHARMGRLFPCHLQVPPLRGCFECARACTATPSDRLRGCFECARACTATPSDRPWLKHPVLLWPVRVRAGACACA